MQTNDMGEKKSWSRQTVNLDDELVPLVRERWERMGFRSFTDYVESLIRSDIAERPIFLRSEEGSVFATSIRQVSPTAQTSFTERDEPTFMVAESSLNEPRKVRPKPGATTQKGSVSG